MNNTLKLLGTSLALALSAISCVNDGFGKENWETPNIICNNKFETSNISLADFVALAPSNGKITITEDYIIDGYVISSDENGTFYKTIVFQDKPENPTIGLQIEVNRSLNYIDFPIGSHIRISTKGLVLGTDRGIVKLGAADTDYAIGRLSETQIENHMSIVCINGKADITTIVPLELPNLAEASKLQHINKLVSVSNVQFSDSDILSGGIKTYVEQSPKKDTDRGLIDKDGTTSILRTAQYASFGAMPLPIGNGKITFVVSKYNKNYQMIIRSTNDINFNGERIDTAPAKGGSAITYLTSGHTIDFTGFPAGVASETLPNYINDPVIGNRYWRVATFSGNKFLQFGYSDKGAKPYAKTFFAIPVDFDNMSQFSFKSKDGYNTNKAIDVLKVYYSTNYKANAISPTLIDITNSFSISKEAEAKGYAPNFKDSGIWNKPSTLKGKGFIIFEYNGGGDLPTTTMQIDDITIN